jgi:hypothetical protein
MPRPNLRFSIIVFGGALAYILLNRVIPGIAHARGSDPLALGVLAIVMLIIVTIVIKNHFQGGNHEHDM